MGTDLVTDEVVVEERNVAVLVVITAGLEVDEVVLIGLVGVVVALLVTLVGIVAPLIEVELAAEVVVVVAEVGVVVEVVVPLTGVVLALVGIVVVVVVGVLKVMVIVPLLIGVVLIALAEIVVRVVVPLVGAIVAVLGVVVAAVTVVVAGVVEVRMEEGMRVRVEETSRLGVVIEAVAEAIEEVELTADAVLETTDALPADGAGAPAAGYEGRDGPLVVTLDIEDDICGGRVDVFNVETIETGLELLE